MGFFSWKCAKTKKSIPAYPWAQRAIEDSTIIMVLPDNTKVSGVYDGYGHIMGDPIGDDLSVYDLIAPFYFKRPDATSDDVFNHMKYLTDPDGKTYQVNQFNYSVPLQKFKGKSLNELRDAGWKIDSDFYLLHDSGMIKIVRADAYNGETYEQLPGSENCPDQGFFYDEDEVA